MKNKFGPKNKREEKVFAIERCRVNVQHVLSKEMHDVNLTGKLIVQKLKLSKRRFIEIYLQPNSNPTIEDLAKFFHAIGKEFTIKATKD